MVDRVVSYVLDGDTYLGSFAIVAIREEEAVMVRYKRTRRSAKIADEKPETVAKTLLGDLVREDLHRGARPIRMRLRPSDGAAPPTPRLISADPQGNRATRPAHNVAATAPPRPPKTP